MTKDKCYIYALLDPTTKIARYIGKSIKPYDRFKSHMRDANNGETTHKATWIRSLIRQSLSPELIIIEECNIDGWDIKEKYYIKMHRELCSDLTNANEGGIRNHKRLLNPIDYKQRDITKDKNPFYGKKHSDEAKQKISKANKGRKNSPEHAKKLIEANLGKKHPERSLEWREKQRHSHLGRKDSDETNKRKSIAQSGENNPRAKIWSIRSPFGDLIQIKSLKTWCKLNDITVGKIHSNTKRKVLDDWAIVY